MTSCLDTGIALLGIGRAGAARTAAIGARRGGRVFGRSLAAIFGIGLLGTVFVAVAAVAAFARRTIAAIFVLVAALTAALGPLSTVRQPAAARMARVPAWLLFGFLLISLLGEVVSRRLRGLA